MENNIAKLIELVINLSPKAWQILVSQAYLEAAAKLLWAAIYWITIYIYHRSRLQIFKKLYDDDNFDTIIKNIIMIVLFLLAIYYTIDGSMWLSNPEFYAIRWLIYQLR